jgi:hypothetical protein
MIGFDCLWMHRNSGMMSNFGYQNMNGRRRIGAALQRGRAAILLAGVLAPQAFLICFAGEGD